MRAGCSERCAGLRATCRAEIFFHVTATGIRDEIVLPDGSRMILNTASAVSLHFEGGTRSVQLLQGEAYFDVAPDPARLFTVVAAFSEVEVKGTAFSVRTENEADTVVVPEVTLVDVAISYTRDDWRVALNASNLFDRTYVASCTYGCFYGEPLKVGLSVSKRW
jgi:ferric-dicitrate binding protein FerR (iron transport regulator)